LNYGATAALAGGAFVVAVRLFVAGSCELVLPRGRIRPRHSYRVFRAAWIMARAFTPHPLLAHRPTGMQLALRTLKTIPLAGAVIVATANSKDLYR